MIPSKLIKRLSIVLGVYGLAIVSLFRCATDSASTAPIAGGAICTYEDCTVDVIVNYVRARGGGDIYTVAHFFQDGRPVDGKESSLTITFAPEFTFTIPGCNTAPTFVSGQTSPTYAYYLAHHTFPTNCTNANVSATITATFSKVGYPDRILNGAGGSSETSGSGGADLTHQTLFATSTRYRGDIGSLGAADTLCINVAAAGSITQSLGGTWKALMSDSTTSALSRITLHAGKAVKNAFGETLKTDAADLFDGNGTLTAVQYDQDANLAAAPNGVWTGTTTIGNYSGSACLDWTSNGIGDNGTAGDVTVTFGWLEATNGSCNPTKHLYCINM